MLSLLDLVGGSVLATTRCDEAMKFLSWEPGIQLVLAGMDLEDGTWETLIDQVKEAHLETPVVVCSPFPTTAAVSQVFERGAYDILMAPYTEDDVRQTVRAAISRSRACSRAGVAAD